MTWIGTDYTDKRSKGIYQEARNLAAKLQAGKEARKRERKYLMSTDKRAGSLEEKSAGIRNVIARTILFPACAAIRLVRSNLLTDHVSASYLENEY